MAEPTVLSAGTFIASVLETAGYLTQARFLDVFEQNGFFREAGAFIFTIGAVGAVVSFLMFGSFRGVRYLLVGPAMFWFLVGSRSETFGSVWKINGQTPQSQAGATSIEGAIARRNEVINKATEGWQGGGQSIKIATGFALFASVTNAVTEDLVKMFMDNAPKKDLSNFGKVRGYEIITMVTPEDSLFVDMLEQDFLVQCAPLMNAAIAMSAVQLRQVIGGGQQAAPAAADANSVSAHYQQIIDQHLNTPDKFVGVATKSYILAQLARTDNGSNVSKTVLTDRNQPFPSISCGKYWELVSEYLIAIAKRKEADILRIARIDVEARAGLGENIVDPCAEIRQLIYGEKDYAGECDLKWAIALFMLKNQIGPNSSYARMLKRHWNTQEMINPIRNANLTPIPVIDNQAWTAAQGLDLGPITRTVPQRANGVVVGYRIEQLYVPRANGTGMRDPHARPAETDRWVEVVPHVGNQGADHAMWVSTQRAQTVNLRQQMFTYALQLPYWQGMILYLIASTYPFMALLVLIPGRAQSFLNVPMAWIWAKSWDVGLAAVIVLDRVMWNMLMNLTPHRLDKTLNQDSWKPEQLVTVLKEAFKIDPGFNIHMYYMLVSVVMLSIPAIAGAATIKAKRSILASFTEALEGHAKDAGMRAASQFQMEVMNTRYGEMGDSGSVAELRSMRQGEGVAGRGRAAIGLAFGTADGLTRGANAGADAARAGGAGGAIRAVKTVPAAVASGVRTFSAQTQAQARFEKAYAETFDPEIGRWGRIQMIQDAYASAMDGSGGFEIKASTENRAVDTFIDAFADRAVTMLKVVENAALAGLKGGEFLAGNKETGGEMMAQGGLAIFYLGILHGAPDDRTKQAALQNGISAWAGITDYQGSNTEFVERAFLLTHEQALSWTGESDPVPAAPPVAPHMIPIINMEEEFRPPRFIDHDLAAAADPIPRPFAMAMRDGDEGGMFVNFPHQGELTALAFAPEAPQEDRPHADRRVTHRFGELPIQLPAEVELQIANNPEQAEEILRQFLENEERLAAIELIHDWNHRREESLHHDEQYRYRMAKALHGRSERDVNFANVLGKRRKWDDEVDIEDDGVA